MIINRLLERPTVFFLGAGANKPYGFPLGSELHSIIISDFSGQLTQLTDSLGLNQALFKQFQEALRFTDHKTIDTFLEHKTNFREIGSIVIAYSIMLRERKENLFHKNDWYQNLFKALEFEESKPDTKNLTVITLNYDRSFEHYFTKSIDYNCKHTIEEQAHKKLSKIKIIHPHGLIGQYPKIKYGTKPSNHVALKEAADNIKIVSDNLNKSPQFQNAIEALTNAYNIIFLGIGYDKQIIDKYFNNIDLREKIIWGTAMGIDSDRHQEIKSYFLNKITLGQKHHNCDAFLRNNKIIN